MPLSLLAGRRRPFLPLVSSDIANGAALLVYLLVIGRESNPGLADVTRRFLFSGGPAAIPRPGAVGGGWGAWWELGLQRICLGAKGYGRRQHGIQYRHVHGMPGYSSVCIYKTSRYAGHACRRYATAKFTRAYHLACRQMHTPIASLQRKHADAFAQQCIRPGPQWLRMLIMRMVLF